MVFVAAIGLPLLLAELALGRSTQRGPEAAFAALAPRGPWRRAGWPGVAVATLILAYYAVIAGWTLKFFFLYLLGDVPAAVPADAAHRFEAFLASAEPVAWQAVVMAACVAIVAGDTACAVVAGAMICPAVFTFGLDPAAGLALAALTSAISLLEVVVAFLFLIDRGHAQRRSAALAAGGAIFALGLPAALSFGVLGGVRVAGMHVLDAMDFVASNVLMPVSGVIVAVFVGWVWAARDARHASTLAPAAARAWHLVVRYAAPAVIALVLLRALGVVGS